MLTLIQILGAPFFSWSYIRMKSNVEVTNQTTNFTTTGDCQRIALKEQVPSHFTTELTAWAPIPSTKKKWELNTPHLPSSSRFAWASLAFWDWEKDKSWSWMLALHLPPIFTGQNLKILKVVLYPLFLRSTNLEIHAVRLFVFLIC